MTPVPTLALTLVHQIQLCCVNCFKEPTLYITPYSSLKQKNVPLSTESDKPKSPEVDNMKVREGSLYLMWWFLVRQKSLWIVFCSKYSQREEEAAIVDSVLAGDHAVLLKSVKKSMFKLVFLFSEMEWYFFQNKLSTYLTYRSILNYLDVSCLLLETSAMCKNVWLLFDMLLFCLCCSMRKCPRNHDLVAQDSPQTFLCPSTSVHIWGDSVKLLPPKLASSCK